MAPPVQIAYEYYFNRDELMGSEIAERSLVALTASGDLLRFDVDNVRLQQTRACSPGYTCIGRSCTGSIIAAAANGDLDEIDPDNLQPKHIATLPGRPMWVGPDRAGKTIIAILTAEFQEERWVERRAVRAWDVLRRVGYDLPRDDRGGASVFAVDRDRQLWLGADHGEWGGWCARLDLRTAAWQQFQPLGMDGVCGFTELHGGSMLVYGGMLHFFGRADLLRGSSGNKLVSILDGWHDHPEPHGPEEPPHGPEMPITHVIEDWAHQRLLVFSFNDIFQLDFSMTHWKWLSSPSMHYVAGRPDAMGSYPAVRSVHLLAGSPSRLLFSTGGDGMMELAGSKTFAHSLENQPRVRAERSFGTSSQGTFIGQMNSEGDDDVFVVRAGSVRPVEIRPPVEATVDGRWGNAYPIHLDANSSTFGFSSRGSHSKTCFVTWRDSVPHIDYFGDRLNCDLAFQTPDGTLWDAGAKELHRLVNGAWQVAGPVPEGRGYYIKKVISRKISPWLILGTEHLLVLNDSSPSASTFTVIDEATPRGRSERTLDAVETADSLALVVTDRGVFLLDRVQNKLVNPPIPVPPEKVSQICEDGQGYLWFGGDHLWVLDRRTDKLQRLDQLPSVATSKVMTLALSPEKKVMAFLDNGAYFTLWAR